MTTTTFKCVIVGDGGVGKTALLREQCGEDFDGHYIPTLGVEVVPIVYNTTKGSFRLNVWDCAGQEMYQGMGKAYYADVDCAIVMFDVTNRISYRNMISWYDSLVIPLGPKVPIVLVGNKSDITDHKILFNDVMVPCWRKYFEISAKSGHGCGTPFLELLGQLLNDASIAFV